ncbi:MAG: LD-carboxypeptidase [Bacteroidales bacterium]
MENITPPYLRPGDTIGIVATARFVSRDEIQPAIRFLTAHGFMVKTSPHLFSQQHQFAGTDEERALDFMEMVEDRSIKAILCARGGYGTVRILDLINLRKLQLNPKWIIGYSDITVLHSLISSWYGIETLHATMPINLTNDISGNESINNLVQVLEGHIPSYKVPHHAMNRFGRATGLLTGGNLSILNTLIGTDADISAQNRILFIEDVDEYLYHIDRMMMHLKRSGKLKAISGLIVGSFSDMRDNKIPFGSDAYEIIYSVMQEYGIPVCFGFPAGHTEPNYTLIMGRMVELRVDKEGAELIFSTQTSQGVHDTLEE